MEYETVPTAGPYINHTTAGPYINHTTAGPYVNHTTAGPYVNHTTAGPYVNHTTAGPYVNHTTAGPYVNHTTAGPYINHTTAGPSISHLPEEYRYALLFLYSVVLVGGVASMSIMINILQSNVRSVTTTAVLNLIAVHLLFLLTVPFRLYYYAAGRWRLGMGLCKVVSWMIFAHIQLAFIFYVIILVIRCLAFYRWTGRVEFYRTLHALCASAAIWAVVVTVFLPIAVIEYGKKSAIDDEKCFDFGDSLQDPAVAVLNYVLSGFILLVTSALAGCQVCILSRVYRTYRSSTFSHQEFRAQMKSLCFVLVMAVCFVPYNAFRIYYVCHQRDSLEPVNEIFLAVTSLSCLDMLVFIGRPTCASCPTLLCQMT